MLKLALLRDVRAAMSDLLTIHNEEIEALLREDFDGMAELSKKLTTARAHKANLIELYRKHIESHGC